MKKSTQRKLRSLIERIIREERLVENSMATQAIQKLKSKYEGKPGSESLINWLQTKETEIGTILPKLENILMTYGGFEVKNIQMASFSGEVQLRFGRQSNAGLKGFDDDSALILVLVLERTIKGKRSFPKGTNQSGHGLKYSKKIIDAEAKKINVTINWGNISDIPVGETATIKIFID